MFTLIPRFIISIRELYARDVQGRRGEGIDTGFGLSSSCRDAGGTAIVFADVEQNELDGVEETPMEDVTTQPETTYIREAVRFSSSEEDLGNLSREQHVMQGAIDGAPALHLPQIVAQMAYQGIWNSSVLFEQCIFSSAPTTCIVRVSHSSRLPIFHDAWLLEHFDIIPHQNRQYTSATFLLRLITTPISTNLQVCPPHLSGAHEVDAGSAPGLDMDNRPTLSILRFLHEARRPRIIIGLRMRDPIPDCISHLALVSDGKVFTGTKEDMLEAQERHRTTGDNATSMASAASAKRTEDEGMPVVVLRKRRRLLWRAQGTPIHQLDHPQRPTLASPRCKRCTPAAIARAARRYLLKGGGVGHNQATLL
ncbi:hypothetical protein OG21DRAFT_1485804 [Imleria badia]|nr:hypothetical protein OG21DRAFT_1485804 [Imleria badia]